VVVTAKAERLHNEDQGTKVKENGSRGADAIMTVGFIKGSMLDGDIRMGQY